MNGARTFLMRKGYLLTALAAAVLLAASPGTALAQTVEIESLTLASPTVQEGGEATATLKFKVSVADGGTAVSNGAATVGFGFSLAGTPALATSPAATNAVEAHFIGLTDTATESTTMVRGINVPVGGSRSYTATRTFGLNDDLDAENQQFRLIGSVSGIGSEVTQDPTGHYTIVDDETQKYMLSIGSAQNAIDEGTASTGSDPDPTDVFLVADPRRTAGAAVPTFTVTGPRSFFTGSGTGGALDDAAVSAGLATGNQGAPSTRLDIGNINPAEDKNRSDDTMTLTLYTGGVGSANVEHELTITVVDIHKLPAASAITAEAKDSDAPNANKVTEITEGGDPVYLTITVDRGSDTDPRNKVTEEALTINIGSSAAQAGDFMVEPARVTLDENTARGKQTATTMVKLTALTDEDVGMENLMLNLVASGAAGSPEGSSTGSFSIAVVDQTEPKIWVLPEDEAYPAITDAMEEAAGDDGFNPTESFMVDGSDLFGVMDGYRARYSVSASGDDAVDISVSPSTVTVMAKKAGSSTVKITATAEMASSSFKAEQDISDEASVMFEVTVVDKALMITLEMPDNVMDGNIVEGMSYDIGVMANRTITEAEGSVEVMIMRDRAESDANADDFMVDESVMIMAGYDSAMATLTVTEDNMPDAGTNDNMGEQLVLYGMAGDMETNALTFTIWDAAVPALPLIAQILLALFLAFGGARLYRRRQG